MSYGFRPRAIERLRGGVGPTLIAIGGLHGNEPGGVAAIGAVLGRLRERDAAIRGDVVGLIGNVRALAAKRRYLARDLNRLWTPDRLAALTPPDPWTPPTTDGAELAELLDLSDELDRAVSAARGPVLAITLHTSAVPGPPFGVIGGTPAYRALADRMVLPAVLGLEERIEGLLTRHLAARGCVTMAIEGGQTDAPETAAQLEAAVILALAAIGCVEPAELPEAAAARDLLVRARGSVPALIEVTTHHEVLPEHEFRMEPGFTNLHPTPAGTLLARDRRGEIRAPHDGFVLFPLYHPPGGEGFFFGRAAA